MIRSHRTRLLLASSALVAAALLSKGDARATGNLETGTGSIMNRVWPAAAFPIPWRFSNSTGAPCGYSAVNAPAAALQPAIAAAFTTHQNVVDSAVSFTFAGNSNPATERNIGLDGVNLVTFCDAAVLASNLGFLARTPSTASTVAFTVVAGGGCAAGQGLTPDLNGGAPGGQVCFPVGSYPAGTIVDADMEFNTFSNFENVFFTTTTTATFYNIQAVGTHEIGHFYGLSHDPIPEAVMFPLGDDEPSSGATGQSVLKTADISTAGRYYPEATYGTAFGSITGTVTIDGLPATGVHVVAIDPNTNLGVAGRMTLTQFQDPVSLGPEGPDFAANGAGFYRIDGLPPGQYYVYVEYFDDSDWITGRLLSNAYNNTAFNSSVARNADPANQAPSWEGFLPALAEFYNTGDSGNGGDGVDPGLAADNSDVGTLVTVTAGAATPGINIAINIEPDTLQDPVDRENPTVRTRLRNDLFQGTDLLNVTPGNGATGGDDWWAVRYLAANLPTPPYNVAEGQWYRAGRSTVPFETRFAFSDPSNPNRPALTDPIIASANRVLMGGSGARTPAGDDTEVVDQWNVTINEPRDIWVLLKQPPFPAGATFITQGFFAVYTCIDNGAGNCGGTRVGRTLLTQNNGVVWQAFGGDMLYDMILEEAPPVMVNSAVPPSLDETDTTDVLVNGVGFVSGATVVFSGGVIVNTVTFVNPQQLRVNVTVPNLGLTGPRGVNVTVTNPGAVFPNVARIFTINRFLDGDGDGVRDSQDCAPADATLKTAAGPFVGMDVIDLGATTQISWTSQEAAAGTATMYDLVTGLIGDLRASASYAMAVCGANNATDTPFVDLNPPPAANAARYWLGRAHNGCNLGAVTFGNSTILPDPRDALDGGAVCAQ